MTTVVLVRHGLTAMTGPVLAGWTPGLHLDERGRGAGRRRRRAAAARCRSRAIVSQPARPLPGHRRRRRRRVGSSERAGRRPAGGVPVRRLDRPAAQGAGQGPAVEGRAEPPVGGHLPRPGGRAAARDAEPRGRRGPRLERPARARTPPGWPARTATSSRRSSPTRWACTSTSSSGSPIDPCSVTVIRYTELRPFVVRVNDTGGGVADLLPPEEGPAPQGQLRRGGRRRRAAPAA